MNTQMLSGDGSVQAEGRGVGTLSMGFVAGGLLGAAFVIEEFNRGDALAFTFKMLLWGPLLAASAVMALTAAGALAVGLLRRQLNPSAATAAALTLVAYGIGLAAFLARWSSVHIQS